MIEVEAAGPRDAWAIGSEAGAEDDEGRGVLLQWDGSTWARVRLPWEKYSINGLDVDGPDDVWILAGSELARRSGGRWTTFEPFGIAENYRLNDISVDKGRAVLIGEGHEGPVIVYWDGRRFSMDTIYDRNRRLHAVSFKSGHTWIVGAQSRAKCQGITPTIQHGDPADKNLIMDDNMLIPIVRGGVLKSVWQTDPDDVWAVGEVSPGERERDYLSAKCLRKATGEEEDVPPAPLVMHWDGATWKHAKLPAWNVSLTSVTAAGKNDVWASGTDPANNVVFLHYDGEKWTRKDRVVSGSDSKANMTTIPGTSELWAVGSINGESDDEEAFILRRR
ncbi:hypothetical protein [Nonomuraea sp. 10N515B]|uniref:hypothetical protein n=1 Tax=Nonomuraea sp. 10N515B TaxID=3457422 RepID=UPI003FCC7ACC